MDSGPQIASGRRLSWNFGVLVIGEILTRGLTFVAFVRLARVLEPHGFGLVEWTLSVMQFCMLSVDLGLGILAAREIARAPEQSGTITNKLVTTRLVLAVIVVGSVLLISFVAPLDPALRWLLRGYGLSLLAVPFIINPVFQAWNEMFWVTTPQVVRQGFFLAVVVIGISSPEHILRLPAAEIAAVGACGALYVILYRGRGFAFPISRDAVDFSLLREALPIGGVQLIWGLRMYLPITLLLFMVEGEQTGLFGSAHRLVMVLQSFLAVYLTNLFPTFSQASLGERLWPIMNRSMLLTVPATVAVALGTMPIASLVLGLVYGPAFVRPESVGSLVVLTWMMPVLALRGHAHYAFVVLNRQREDLRGSVGGILLLVLLIVPATLTWGAIGTAGAMLASELVTTIWLWRMLRREPPAVH